MGEMMVRDVRRVLVIGAGIGGLAAGAALGQHGVETVLVERKPDNIVAGVGLNLPGNALRAMARIGLLEAALDHGYTFDRVEFRDRFDQHVVTVRSQLAVPGVPANCALQRSDLARLLEGAAVAAGSEVRYATTVSELHTEPDGVVADLSDGSSERFDLVLAFDGIRSSTRTALFGVEPVHTGYSVWRVALDRHPDITHNMYYQGMGNKAGLFPLNEKVMYLLHVTPEPGNPRYQPERFVEHLRGKLDGYTGRVGQIRDALADGDDVVYAPIEEVFLEQPWHRDRVLVLGDAAHAMAPHRTQGAAMAIEDAVVAGEVLSGDAPLADLLAEYAGRRHDRCALVQKASKDILLGEMNTTDQALLDQHLDFLRHRLSGVAGRVDAALNEPF
jgi:2-polyprenyl-6-methoxyphenol hydroxylase-like FAD-dependent oxidoreductase